MSTSAPRVRRLLWVAGLFALALALRWLPLEHGLPRNYLPDTHAVRAALGMAKDRDLAPEVGKYSSYPYLMPYMLLPVYGAQYGLGKLQGNWKNAEEFGAELSDHPERAALPARALVACFGALTALVVYFAARAAGLGRGALAAMFLTATGLLHVQLSVHERPWVITVFFGALCLWSCVLYSTRGRGRWLALSGVFAGLAFATHQAGAFFAFLTAASWCFSARGAADWKGSALRKRATHPAMAAVLCAIVGLLCGHAYYLVHGSVGADQVAGAERAAENFTIGGQALGIGWSWQSFRHLGRALVGYDPVLLGLGLIGLWLAWRSRCLRGPVAFTLFYALFFLFNPSDHVRYLVPLTVLLAIPAGVACEAVCERTLGRVACCALLALPLVQASRLVWLLRQEDTRAEAERRLEKLSQTPGEAPFVVIDNYGPAVDLSRGSLEELAGLRELRTREARRLERLRAGGAADAKPGIHAVFAEELLGYDVDERSYGVTRERRKLAETPQELFRKLGVTHFALVNRRPGDPTAPFLSALAQTWTPVWTIDPSRPDRESPEAFLPTEMDFPLSGLWRVDRPGPWIGLFALPRP